MRIPELSLADYLHGNAQARATFSKALMRGLQRYGFVVVRDHPIPATLIEEAYALTARFFAQTEDVKRQYIGGTRGYVPLRTEHAKSRTVPDLKEFWQIGPEPDGAGSKPGTLTNIWPQAPERFNVTFVTLFNALQETGQVILAALTPGLAVAEDFFTTRLAERNSVLRLLHYPPIAGDEDVGAVRSAAHEDINLLTLLLAPHGPGLELLDRDGRWLPINTRRNDLIVDSGDMMALITNDVIPATTHRVVNPSAENISRYSMPFFMHPDADVMLRCLPSCGGEKAKYTEIRAGAFLEQRLTQIGLLESRDR
jgi:isopenicillin N synthase-like dioxygenase